MREQGWHKQPRSDLQGIRGDVMISIYNFKNDETPSKDLKQGMTSMHLETSLVVQWLRICLPVQGMWVQSLVGELRSHMQLSLHTATKTHDSQKKEKFYSASWSVNNREPTRAGISGHLQCPTWENGWLVGWFTAETYSHLIATP